MKRPIQLNTEDPKIKKLQKAIELISESSQGLANFDIARQVLECLMYIKQNPEWIRYAITHKDDQESVSYLYDEDREKQVLRDHNGMAFHIINYDIAEDAINDYTNLIQSVENCLDQFVNNPIFFKGFIQNIKNSDVGCLEARLADALVFAGMVEQNGKLRLDDLMELFWNEIPKTDLDCDLSIFKSALNYFAFYIDMHYPIIVTEDGACELTWQIVKTYLADVFYLDITQWPILSENIEKPNKTSEFKKMDIKWKSFSFNTEQAAQQYLNFVKSILTDDPLKTELEKALIRQTRSGQFRFLLTEVQQIAFLTALYLDVAFDQNNQLDGIISSDFLFKSLRLDENCFITTFAKGVTFSDNNRIKMELRKPKKIWTVTGQGVFKRSEKPQLYTKQQKMGFSPYQSTSLAWDKYRPPVFGHNRNRKSILVGVKFEMKDVQLSQRLYKYDGGTVGRPFDFDEKEEANQYHNEKVDQNLFSDLGKFKYALQNESQDNYNEVLARLRWNTDCTSSVVIFSNNFESRLAAIELASIMRKYAKARAEINGDDWDESYQVPIEFYHNFSESDQPIFTTYSEQVQQLDVQAAREIFDDVKKRNTYINNGEFHFLLNSENAFSSLAVTYNDRALIFELIERNQWFVLTCLLQNMSPLEVNDLNNLMAVQIESDQRTKDCCQRWLMKATKDGQAEIVAFLLNTNVRDFNFHNEGESLLHDAVKNRQFEIVKLLLDNDATTVDQRDQNNKTALYYAAENGSLAIVNLLIEKGADVFKSCAMNTSPILIAVIKGHYKIIKKLIKEKYDVDKISSGGMTALLMAVHENNLEIVKLLTENGADIHKLAKRQLSPLQKACISGNLDIIEVFIDSKVDINGDHVDYAKNDIRKKILDMYIKKRLVNNDDNWENYSVDNYVEIFKRVSNNFEKSRKYSWLDQQILKHLKSKILKCVKLNPSLLNKKNNNIEEVLGYRRGYLPQFFDTSSSRKLKKIEKQTMNNRFPQNPAPKCS